MTFGVALPKFSGFRRHFDGHAWRAAPGLDLVPQTLLRGPFVPLGSRFVQKQQRPFVSVPCFPLSKEEFAHPPQENGATRGRRFVVHVRPVSRQHLPLVRKGLLPEVVAAQLRHPSPPLVDV